jgi:hypothetical protein
MKKKFKSLSSRLGRKKPVKLATDLNQVQKESVWDILIRANDSFIKALMGIYSPFDQ